MPDQANALRRLVRQDNRKAAPHAGPKPKLIVVTSGKGGVGTTTIAVNLAIALSLQKHGVMLVDVDPNGGNTAMLCRLEERYSVADLLAARRTLSEVLQPGPGGIQVLPGTWASTDISDYSDATQDRLIRPLQSLGDKYEYVVIDVGNGLNRMARRFWQIADAVLLVTTPQLPSVMDSYASVKVLAVKNNSMPIYSVVNMESDPIMANNVHQRLARSCRRFLGVELQQAGFIPATADVIAAGQDQQPFVLVAPKCSATQQLHLLAKVFTAKGNKSQNGSINNQDEEEKPALRFSA